MNQLNDFKEHIYLFIYNSDIIHLSITSQLISILDELQNVGVTGPNNNTDSTHLTDYFCSEMVFNLSKRALSDAEIKVFGKRTTLCAYTK